MAAQTSWRDIATRVGVLKGKDCDCEFCQLLDQAVTDAEQVLRNVEEALQIEVETDKHPDERTML